MVTAVAIENCGVGVDVIVRFHDLTRVRELQRAVFSLIGQELRPLRILLSLQRFSDEEQWAVREALAALLALPDAPEIAILRYDLPEPLDARSALINLGFAHATGRYVAILDYDDVIYPEAYRLLTKRLQISDAGIAFGGIGVKRVEVYDDFLCPTAQINLFQGNTLSDLFRSNFCPIHSFVVDRTRVPAEDLRFEPTLSVEEDYEFLLRVCAKVRSDFDMIGTQIGEYYFKSDDSNTVAKPVLPPATRARLDGATAFNNGRRLLTPLSEVVQRQLGLPSYRPGLTIQAFLDEIKR